jgi:hypothetical protein
MAPSAAFVTTTLGLDEQTTRQFVETLKQVTQAVNTHHDPAAGVR